MELKNKTRKKKKAGKQNLQCKIGFRKTPFLCPLLSKLLSGQSAKFFFFFMTEVGSLYLKDKIKMESINTLRPVLCSALS